MSDVYRVIKLKSQIPVGIPRNRAEHTVTCTATGYNEYGNQVTEVFEKTIWTKVKVRRKAYYWGVAYRYIRKSNYRAIKRQFFPDPKVQKAREIRRKLKRIKND